MITDAVMEKVNEELRSWKMPQVMLGDRVMWYPGAHEDIGRGCVAIVADMTKEYLEVVTLGRKQHLQLKRQARHISDPRLALGGDWLNSGTWSAMPPSHADISLGGRLRSAEAKIVELYKTREEVKDLGPTIEEISRELLDLKKALAKSAKREEATVA